MRLKSPKHIVLNPRTFGFMQYETKYESLLLLLRRKEFIFNMTPQDSCIGI